MLLDPEEEAFGLAVLALVGFSILALLIGGH